MTFEFATNRGKATEAMYAEFNKVGLSTTPRRRERDHRRHWQ
jgi:hypothetical protein